MKLVIVGCNPTESSVRAGHYYAGRGNQFWPTLYESGVVPEPFDYPDDRRIIEFGIGLTDLVKQVLHGRPWEGTLAVKQADGARLLIRARAAPLYDLAGEVHGLSMVAREATMKGSRRERDRLRLLERIGERLARSLELDVTLRHVAETLVPQFADHCLVDLFQGDKLIRKEDHAGIIDCYISRVENGKFEVKKRIPKEELAANMPLRHNLSTMPV